MTKQIDSHIFTDAECKTYVHFAVYVKLSLQCLHTCNSNVYVM